MNLADVSTLLLLGSLFPLALCAVGWVVEKLEPITNEEELQ
jgi:hypothetical protein